MPNTEEWGKGYDFGQIGMMKAIKTAEDTATAMERNRIIGLLQNEIDKHTKVLELRPDRSDADVRHTICRTYQVAIQIIKGEYK